MAHIAVFLSKPFGPDALDTIDAILERNAERIDRTRKGRHWGLVIGNMIYTVHASKTEEQLWDHEDTLLQLELLPEDAPLYVGIGAPLNTDEAFQIITAIAEQLCDALGGRKTEPWR
jgi:hypothetical protein